ncbi:protein FAM110B isoform X2 [Macaca fascicularis]|uniref:protein FAM110B isoform X2 n=1 Tax=Macaca fascicularis TaxID=9541 RepID=UPI003D156A20
MEEGRGARGACTLAQGHALSATATGSKFPPSLSGEACLSPPTRCRPNHRGRRQPGPPRPRVLGPFRQPRLLSTSGPATVTVRTRQPLQPALGPPSLAGPDSPSSQSPGAWRPARAAPPGTGVRGPAISCCREHFKKGQHSCDLCLPSIKYSFPSQDHRRMAFLHPVALGVASESPTEATCYRWEAA